MYNTLEIYCDGNNKRIYVDSRNIENIKFSINKKHTFTEFERKNIIEIKLKLDENIKNLENELNNWGLCKSKENFEFYRNIKIREILDDKQYRFLSFYYLGMEKFEQNEKGKFLTLTLRQRPDKIDWIATNEPEDKKLDEKYMEVYKTYMQNINKNKKVVKVKKRIFRFFKEESLQSEEVEISKETLKKYLEKGFRFKNIVEEGENYE